MTIKDDPAQKNNMDCVTNAEVSLPTHAKVMDKKLNGDIFLDCYDHRLFTTMIVGTHLFSEEELENICDYELQAVANHLFDIDYCKISNRYNSLSAMGRKRLLLLTSDFHQTVQNSFFESGKITVEERRYLCTIYKENKVDDIQRFCKRETIEKIIQRLKSNEIVNLDNYFKATMHHKDNPNRYF